MIWVVTRQVLRSLVNVMSAVLGALIVLPRISESFWSLQMLLNEMPALTTLTGISVLRKRGRSLSALPGLLTVLVSTLPYLRFFSAQRAMDASMKAALGEDYVEAIPAYVQGRVMPTHWLFFNLPYMLRGRRVRVEKDILYVKRPQRDLYLDVYYPPDDLDSGVLHPAIINVHGGGWNTGNKREYFSGHHRALAAQGYVVFDIQYRLTAEDGVMWPEPLHDVRAAIRFVRRESGRFGINPGRIALMGRSAGGHLAFMAAYTAQGVHADTKVQALVGYYVPANLMLVGPEHDYRVLGLLGETSYDNPQIYQSASPLHRVGHDAPPALLLHGEKDSLVAPFHSQMLHHRLSQLGRPCAVLRVPWGRHVFDFARVGLGYQLTQYYADRFLARCLFGEEVT